MIEVIYFLECAFVIGDLDCMTPLNNVHILCIIASKFRLIGPFQVDRLGRHFLWRPTMHLGTEKNVFQGSICKKCFSKRPK
jgi:hypothetical protein